MVLLRVVERVARQALIAEGLESRFRRTSVAKLHLYDAPGRGDLPTVVLLHGISSAATPFAKLIRHLRPHVRRVLAPEAPGHGFSTEPVETMTPDSLFEGMAELLDEELDEPAIVFGNSLGGAVALSYGLARPERVRGLFLASPAGAHMSAAELEAFLAAFDVRSPAEARAFLSRIYHRTPWFLPLFAPQLQRLFARPAVRGFRATVRPEHLFTSERVRELRVPCHLLWGRSERLLPDSSLEFFLRSLPAHATLARPDRIGHCAHLEDPVDLAQRIVAFSRVVTGDSVPVLAAS